MNFISEILAGDGTYVARLFAATILGGIIGLERQRRGRSAGLRTNILVCLGSAAVIVAFQKIYDGSGLDAASAIRMDPARAAAGVITGIGFLGAGTIVKSKDFVRGLTTAASIWVVSAVGVTLGLGDYTIAVVLTLLVLLTLFLLHMLPVGGDQYAPLRLEWHGDLALVDEVAGALEEGGADIKHRSLSRQPGSGRCRAVLSLRYRDPAAVQPVFDRLQEDERFDEVAWD